MNHQPFEDWLLNDKPMTQQQKHELDIHIRTCAYCAALAETGIALKSVKKVSLRQVLCLYESSLIFFLRLDGWS